MDNLAWSKILTKILKKNNNSNVTVNIVEQRRLISIPTVTILNKEVIQ